MMGCGWWEGFTVPVWPLPTVKTSGYSWWTCKGSNLSTYIWPAMYVEVVLLVGWDGQISSNTQNASGLVHIVPKSSAHIVHRHRNKTAGRMLPYHC